MSDFERLIAVGDIHGQLELLADLLEQIQPSKNDQFVFLGDYIDRGPNSKGVIQTLIDFKQIYPQTVFIRGNHEQMFLDSLIECGALEGKRLQEISWRWGREMMRDTDVACFKRNGGGKTLEDYGVEIVRDSSEGHTLWPTYIMIGEMPQAHLDFLQGTQLYCRHDYFTFVHAGYFTRPAADRDAGETIEEQAVNDPYILLWERYGDTGQNGETVVVGHTPVQGEPFVEPGRINLDTGAAYGRELSAMDVLSGQVWQSRPVQPDWLSTKFDKPERPGNIILLDNKNNKEIPAYFDGRDCVIGSTTTPFEKFSFWRPIKNENLSDT